MITIFFFLILKADKRKAEEVDSCILLVKDKVSHGKGRINLEQS